MPRCMTRTSPEERSARRYLARRPNPTTVLPSSRAAKSFGSGQRRSRRCATTLAKRTPSMTGARPRRTVSTSGNSGMIDGQVGMARSGQARARPRDIASPAPARYGPARKGLFEMPPGRENTRFGDQVVPLADKQGLVDDVFRSVAGRYDLMNDLMSGGLHRAWKDALVTAVNPPRARPASAQEAKTSARPFALLDLAGGTGDIAF